MSTTNPKNFIELLTVFHYGLANGFIDKQEVINWADRIITIDSEPDNFIIEISLTGHKSINDIITLFNEYVNVKRTQLTDRVILGLLHKRLIDKQLTLRKVVELISRLAWESDFTNEEKGFMYGLDEDFDCAVEGIYSSVQTIENDAKRFTEIYQDFRLDNFDSWTVINKTIDSRVNRLLELVKAEQEEITKAQTKKKWWKLW